MTKTPMVHRAAGRQLDPDEKMANAIQLAQEALADEARFRKEMEARFDALKNHCDDFDARVETIVHMALIEDINGRDPADVVEAVMKRLSAGPS